jgi:hypothetical protein
MPSDNARGKLSEYDVQGTNCPKCGHTRLSTSCAESVGEHHMSHSTNVAETIQSVPKAPRPQGSKVGVGVGMTEARKLGSCQ